jgi:hypothetical protein
MDAAKEFAGRLDDTSAPMWIPTRGSQFFAIDDQFTATPIHLGHEEFFERVFLAHIGEFPLWLGWRSGRHDEMLQELELDHSNVCSRLKMVDIRSAMNSIGFLTADVRETVKLIDEHVTGAGIDSDTTMEDFKALAAENSGLVHVSISELRPNSRQESTPESMKREQLERLVTRLGKVQDRVINSGDSERIAVSCASSLFLHSFTDYSSSP